MPSATANSSLRRGVYLGGSRIAGAEWWAQGGLAARHLVSYLISLSSQVTAPTRIACPVLAARSHGRGSCTAVGAH